MKHSLRYMAVLTLLLAPLSAAFAQTTVIERHPLSSGGRVEISNVAGKVTMRGWDRNEVQLTGSLGEGQTLEVENSANRVKLRVVYPRDGRNSRGAQLELRVPRSAELQASTVSADLDVADVDLRRLQAQSVSGAVTAAGTVGEGSLTTVSGSIRSVLSTARLQTKTVSGSINASGASGGDVTAETVSGSVTLALSKVQRLSAESVSGGLTVSSDGLGAGGRISLQTVSGKAVLTLPSNSSAQLRVKTFSGSIQSDVGQVERPKYGPGGNLAAKIGGGDGDISITSHSGGVRVRLDGR